MIHSGKTDCSPADVGYNQGALEALDAHFQRLIGKGTIKAAAYLLSKDGKIFAHRSMGRQSAHEDKGDFLPDSIRPLASITKVFTATAVLQLMEKGLCYPDQPVSEIIREFDTDMHKHITIFQLLTHTSGLKADPGNFFEPYPAGWGDGRWTKRNWIKKVLSGPLQFKPGTVWNYCTAGFFILAEVVARLSGMDYDTYIQKHILTPLGMDSSFFILPEGYRDKFSMVSPWNKEQLNEDRAKMPSPSLFGGGGLLSTLPDLWRFGQMMLNKGVFNGKRILGRKTVEAAVKPHIRDIKSYNWRPHMFDDSFNWTCGLGWEINKHGFLSHGTFDHEGAEGAGLFIDPTENFIFAGFYPDRDWHGEAWISPLAIAWSGIA
jgi:CubicO group peptidase (beta-lactamase class C family)